MERAREQAVWDKSKVIAAMTAKLLLNRNVRQKLTNKIPALLRDLILQEPLWGQHGLLS